MGTQEIGMISGSLVVVSVIPYAIRTYQGKIMPNLTSWGLWSVIAVAILLTYRESGAKDNVWPAIFGVTNPILVTVIAIWRRSKLEPMTRWEKLSAVGCILSLVLWFALRGNKGLSQFALYLAILADLCAYVPTYIFVRVHPESDRPGPWILFGIAYGLGAFAATDSSVSNYVLPVYMFFGALGASIPLIRYRVKAKVPIAEWI
ncbi:MAG TPA: hypothetical protein VIJ88_01255 [Candidatus Paceibacterota bacterium]